MNVLDNKENQKILWDQVDLKSTRGCEFQENDFELTLYLPYCLLVLTEWQDGIFTVRECMCMRWDEKVKDIVR